MATIEQSIEVDVPVQTAYDQWTQFESFPRSWRTSRRSARGRQAPPLGRGVRRHPPRVGRRDHRAAPRRACRVAQHRRQGQRRRRHVPQARRQPLEGHGPDGLRARGHQGEGRRGARVRRPRRQGRPRAVQGADRAARRRERRMARRGRRPQARVAGAALGREPGPGAERRGVSRYTLRRTRLGDGEETTTYVVRHALAGLRPRRPRLPPAAPPGPLVRHARRARGGRRRLLPARPVPAAGRRLVRRRARSRGRRSRPRTTRCARRCTPTDGRLAIAPRGAPARARRRATCCRRARCSSRTARSCSTTTPTRRASPPAPRQFDSDITDGRHPRAAIGIDDRHLWLLACDGRRSRHRRRADDARARPAHARSSAAAWR